MGKKLLCNCNFHSAQQIANILKWTSQNFFFLVVKVVKALLDETKEKKFWEF